MTTYIPLIIIAVLFIALIFNAVCMVVHKMGQRKQAKDQQMYD